ncbi:hypothetical protein CsatB_008501 [Cannabis sativa]|uniref:Uncharacterized protein n=1 Tax=Cannabis sativa TaxID=3483 RepID=A0A7J6FQG6_CANSA|nr:uncharacterized protein LOC115703100 [Cannabis sativa]KAF4372953.1 hypothetical protein G4B88_018118 [Cannabis sativa]KAF4373150.1 hypothetical protein F8388_019332 [Cannabis sativa]
MEVSVIMMRKIEEAVEGSIKRRSSEMEQLVNAMERSRRGDHHNQGVAVAMEVSIRRTFPNDLFNFVVQIFSTWPPILGGGRILLFTVHTVWAEIEDDAKKWVSYIQKLFRKRRRIILALSADRSLNYPNGNFNTLIYNKKDHKDQPYELLQICIEDQCLIYKLDSIGQKFNPKVLKDLLHDSRVTVVGVGIENVARRLEEDHGWFMPKVVELRDLAAQAQAQTKAQKADIQGSTSGHDNGKKIMTKKVMMMKRNFSRFGIAKLAKVVLGKEMNIVKPTNIRWWSVSDNFNRPPRFHSEDLIKYATVEAFLISQMGTKLIILDSKTDATTSSQDLN